MRPVHELRQHVLDLGKTHSVRIIEDSGLALDESVMGTAAVGAKGVLTIVVPPIVHLLAYGTALHELGHAVAPNGRPKDPSRTERLAAEEAAWAWARQQAREWTAEMDADKDRCLWHYAQAAQQPEPAGMPPGLSGLMDAFAAAFGAPTGPPVAVAPPTPEQAQRNRVLHARTAASIVDKILGGGR